MKINSKWSYIVVGVDFMIAIIGAIFHNSFLLILGIFCMILNYYSAEFKRRLEDEQLRESITNAKSETEE